MENINNPVFIEFETKTREFKGKLLLISHLLQSGFSRIYFGANRPLRKEALSFRNGIYFFKSVSISEIDLYKKLKKNGFILCLLHAEGGIYYKNSQSSIQSLFNEEALNFFDYIYVFGEKIKNDIINCNGSQLRKKIIVSGEPRFDLLKSKYENVSYKSINKLKSQYEKFILINTSFSASNPLIGIVKLKDYWLNEPTLTKETRDLLMIKIDFFKIVIEHYILAIESLAREFPTINFVLRPHPSESEAFYREKFKGIDNIIINKKGDVTDWIKASIGVIHYDCTTGIESLMADKPVISFTPILDDRVVAWLPTVATKNITTLSDLTLEINNIIEGRFNFELSDDIKHHLLETINNFLTEASPIISSDLLNKAAILSEPLQTGHFIRHYYEILNYNIRMWTKKIIGILKGQKNISMEKFGTITISEIINIMEEIKKSNDFKYKFHVKRHTTNSFLIKK
jgi:surface carbohydrate biosynthesis protein